MLPDPIDRITPTLRPHQPVVMYQSWRHLLFLHWEVPADSLRALLPSGLDLDTFDGRAYVGLVPFTMTGVRPRFLPGVPWLSNFHETNVRTYVHRGGCDPGVWFFSLDAANPVAVVIARATFGLPYYHARMGLKIEDRAGLGPTLTYTSERLRSGLHPPMVAIQARVTGPASPATPGSLDHFLIERYLLYSVRRGHLLRGQVHHRPYPIRPAEVDSLRETLVAASGIDRPDIAPLAHYVSGVDVEVFRLSPA